jgi:hypothetical protein
MPLRAIAYASEAVASLSAERLRGLVNDAVAFNEAADITGVLLFDGHRFLQYLEGPQQGVDAAWRRILDSGSHHSVVELNRGRIGRRQFSHWRMGLLQVEHSALGRVALSDWTGFVRSTAITGVPTSALDRLQLLTAPLLRAGQGGPSMHAAPAGEEGS